MNFEQIEPEMMVLIAFVAGLLVMAIIMLIRSFFSAEAKTKNQLKAARTELAQYKDDVDKHFATTAELFRDVTERYSNLHEHLASGAKSLSSNTKVDDLTLLGREPAVAAIKHEDTPAQDQSTDSAEAKASAEDAPTDNPSVDVAEATMPKTDAKEA